MWETTTMPEEASTPFLLIDERILRNNILRMQKLADQHNVRLRPHVKTHKSSYIADLQLSAGAVGVTASKPGEAMLFITSAVPSLTVAYPLIDTRTILPLLEAARRTGTELRFIADSPHGIEALKAAALRTESRLPLFLKIDVGLHRCGVTEHSPELLPLARAVQQERHLEFRGLLSHAGHAYGAGNSAGAREVARQERECLTRIRERLEAEGIPIPEVSVGSTPTVLAADSFEGITEIRPGNYVFLDRTQTALGVAQPPDVALTVTATVISRNNRYAIIDAGSKTLSSDRGPHGMESLEGFGTAQRFDHTEGNREEFVVEKLSEEHGFLRHDGRDLSIGTRVRITPNHSCTAVNLAERCLFVPEMNPPHYEPVLHSRYSE